MLYFRDFEFNPSTSTLYRHGDVVALTETQLNLLILLLNEPEKIWSKEAILQVLWQDKDVTEQVVFQTISQLRAVLGSDAIQTFPKRGYKWQLSLTQARAQLSVNKTPIQHSGSRFWVVSALLFIFTCGIAYLGAQQSSLQKATSKYALALSPITVTPHSEVESQIVQQLNEALSTQLDVELSPLKKVNTLTSRQSHTLKPHEGTRMLTVRGEITKLSMAGGVSYLLDYTLSGESRQWQSFVIADDVALLANRVHGQIELLSHSRYFELVSENQVTAELTLMNAASSDNLSIAYVLISQLIEGLEYDRASTLLHQYQNQLRVKDQFHQALFNLLKGQLLYGQGQNALAVQSLNLADKQFEKLKLAGLQSETKQLLVQSLSLTEEYRILKMYLIDAAQLAKLAGRTQLELASYYQLSKLAARHQQSTDKYRYLALVSQVVTQFGLDESHLMLRDYHQAIFAKVASEKLTHLQRAILRPVSEENRWVYYAVADLASNLLITEKNWQGLVAFTAALNDDVLRAKLIAKKQVAMGSAEAWHYVERAFEVARQESNYWVSVPMALLLLKLESEQVSEHLHIYQSHIEQFASPSFKARHSQYL
ncbi:winged helix-turn-helix domain-containing protein [Pseudoalteromonas luteoviolacea]|uniref:DNA-binding winged-HTH domain protein n=1 Tax=Pseudoalteromonas luteoviolacea (strain 2ta16) TaxID=1353533 RepID=V4HPQ7_PSEL2|nr:winged helix-turn-helix domain-containing protein [Pseudoalteromonas luteoviolacea]ESP91778.1 DNA-binding winged-HTH domain protein [Pseudoalteromonas luteoviolacea 2ta16]KZN40743.1 hypothetical protein N483_16575 [Pseudoalteromonas luteoviolacea NCIMB 1944]